MNAVKEKISWYCEKLGIEEPSKWNYETVSNVASLINSKMKSAPILICDYCLKVDIDHTHNCNPNRLSNPTQEY